MKNSMFQLTRKLPREFPPKLVAAKRQPSRAAALLLGLASALGIQGSIGAGLQAVAQEAKPAEGPKVTYDDHVRPILREHCFTCHNQNGAKGGLALDSYTKTMEGGSSGQVVIAGDIDSSRLWALVAHIEEPKMPPMQDKLAVAKLDVLKKWIETGAAENSGSKVVIKKKKTFDLVGSPNGQPSGPTAMPENLLKQPIVVTPRAGAVTAMATSPGSPVVAIAGQRQINLYHSENGKLLGVLAYPEGIPYVLRFSRNGAVLLAGGGRGGHSGSVTLYDVKTGKRIQRIGDELDAVLSADIIKDLSKVALGGPQKLIRVYSTETGEQLYEMKKHTDWVYSVQFSPDGVLLATGDRSGGLFVWEAETGREYLNLRGHNGAVLDVSWRPDSNVLASAGEDASVRLWEMNDGNQIKTWNAHGGGTLSVAYAADGRIITGGKDNTVKAWDGNGAAQKTFPAMPEAALKVAITHDGLRVLGGDWQGNVKMWNYADAKELTVLAPNPPTLEVVAQQAAARVAPAQAAATAAANELAVVTQAAADAAVALK
ncbi:MAG: c-type cytochrome domain-containing protein, partial [Planctomycetota bacterium]